MSEDADYLFALKLQERLDAEATHSNSSEPPQNRGSPAGQRRAAANEQPATAESDYALARRLQAQIDAEHESEAGDGDSQIFGLDMTTQKKTPTPQPPPNNRKSKQRVELQRQSPAPRPNFVRPQDDYLNQTQNLVHPQWELVDPTPDVFAMFVRFDERFFQRRLGAVVVEWSKKMYSCAGICYQRSNRYVKEVTIRLSEPLLKLRPRKDLVETLLHEMIHAYCFVQNIREGNGGHGPNFKRIMTTINKVAGTNITVYHSFHDEVDLYKTHVWRCNGICQHHHPFQGWVKRTNNRAPGPSDQWWEKHQRECSGVFVKVSEPKKNQLPSKPKAEAKSKSKTKTDPAAGDDIRNYFGKPAQPIAKPKPQPSSTPAPAPPPAPPPTAAIASAFPPSSYPGLSSDPFASVKSSAVGNVVGLKDLNDSGGDSSGDRGLRGGKIGNQIFGLRSPPRSSNDEMTGQGYSMVSTPKTEPSGSSEVDRSHLRELWSKRFEKDKPKEQSKSSDGEAASKRPRLDDSDDVEIVTWESYDDDVMVRDVQVPIIAISDSEEEEQGETEAKDSNSEIMEMDNSSQRVPMSSQERTMIIKREVMEDESMYDDDDIIMIDDEYDDTVDDLVAATELADQSIIDDLFGEDTLLEEFQRENDVVPSGSRYNHDAANDITMCPICFEKMKRSDFANHLEGCSITIKVMPPTIRGAKSIATMGTRSINTNNNSSNNKRKRGSVSTSTADVVTPRITRQSSPRAKRNSLPRVTLQSSPRAKRQSSPRVKRPSSPRVTRQASPRAKRQSSPRVKRQSSPRVKRPSSPRVKRPSSPRVTRQSSRQILKDSGYTDAEIAALELNSSSSSESVQSVNSDSEDNSQTPRQLRQRNLFNSTVQSVKSDSEDNSLTPRQLRQRNLFKSTVQCPLCGRELRGHQLEAHEQNCASAKSRRSH